MRILILEQMQLEIVYYSNLKHQRKCSRDFCDVLSADLEQSFVIQSVSNPGSILLGKISAQDTTVPTIIYKSFSSLTIQTNWQVCVYNDKIIRHCYSWLWINYKQKALHSRYHGQHCGLVSFHQQLYSTQWILLFLSVSEWVRFTQKFLGEPLSRVSGFIYDNVFEGRIFTSDQQEYHIESAKQYKHLNQTRCHSVIYNAKDVKHPDKHVCGGVHAHAKAWINKVQNEALWQDSDSGKGKYYAVKKKSLLTK